MNRGMYIIKSWHSIKGENEEMAFTHEGAVNIWSRLIHVDNCDRVEVYKSTPINGNLLKIMTFKK